MSHPGDPTYDNKIAPILIKSKVFAGNSKLQLNELNINLGNRVTVEDDPNEDFGKGKANITGRSIGGNMVAPMTLKSVRDPFTSWQLSTEQAPLTLMVGSVAGNRLAITPRGNDGRQRLERRRAGRTRGRRQLKRLSLAGS